MLDRPIVRISPADLDGLLGALDLRLVALVECIVSPGYGLDLYGFDAPGLHYNLGGNAMMRLEAQSPIHLAPHTLVVVPPSSVFRLYCACDATTPVQTVDTRLQKHQPGPIRRFVAGRHGEARVIMICGYFHATYGSSKDLFETLPSPIVEQFDEGDRLDQTLKAAMAELVAQEVGSAIMSEALLRQVIVALVRRSLSSASPWVERFGMLRDPQIARAFSMMAADPGGPHTVQRLARSAGLSRSAFMARFTEVTGHTPMGILRSLRMREAARLLRATNLAVEEIVHNVGYESRSSFVRAFRHTYARDPSEYRASRSRGA